jgi:hypothetical protein
MVVAGCKMDHRWLAYDGSSWLAYDGSSSRRSAYDGLSLVGVRWVVVGWHTMGRRWLAYDGPSSVGSLRVVIG